jgi:hypothetical protein
LPREVRDAAGELLLAHHIGDVNEAAPLAPQPRVSQDAAFRTHWPEAARCAVDEFCAAVESGSDPLRRGQQQLTLCRAWQDIAGKIGPPDLIHGEAPFRPLTSIEFEAMRTAAEHDHVSALDGHPGRWAPTKTSNERDSNAGPADATMLASSGVETKASGVRELLAMISPAGPWALRVAATLRLADCIGSGLSNVKELASAVGANADALERLLAFLVSRGIFVSPEPGQFELNAAARLLRDDDLAQLRKWLDLHGAGGRMDAAWPRLFHSVRTGGPAYIGERGGFWDDIVGDAAMSRSFNELMASVAARVAEDIVSGYDWSLVGSMVDIGGGNGVIVGKLLAAFPRLSATLIELPDAAQFAEHHFAAVGVSHRCKIVTGSFFEFVSPGADVYLLANVLHDWSNEEAVLILRRCSDAARPGGRVLIAERIRGPENARTCTEDDLRFLILFGGRVRCLDEFHRLAAEAQLVPVSTCRMRSGISIIELATAKPPKENRL